MPRKRQRGDFSRTESIRAAIGKIEKRWPQFRRPDYQPPPEGAEAKAFADRQLLQTEVLLTGVGELMTETLRERSAMVDGLLGSFGLKPVTAESQPAAPAEHRSRKATRGEICDQVIREVKFLKDGLLAVRAASASFGVLHRRYPNLMVLDILTHPPFDDDDRYLVCHPAQWDGRAETYAVGILKRYFGKAGPKGQRSGLSEETIKDYRKAYRREARQRSH